MVIKRGEHRLKPRQLGIALIATAEGEFGRALFEKEPGSGVYYEFEVKAIEYFREHHEVWVVDNDNGITEHTPQELKYEDALGVPHRAGENTPLPVSMGRKAITWVTVIPTTSGNTVIATPSSGKKIRVHGYIYSNKHTADVEVGMRFGSAGDVKHRAYLAAQGGNLPVNLTDEVWEGAADETLNAYLVADASNGVIFNVGYTEED